MDVNANGTRLRVALVAMPSLVRDIIRTTITQEPDMCVVAEYETANDVVQVTQQDTTNEVDVVVLGVGIAHGDASNDAFRILQTIPRARVLTVAANGRNAALYMLRPQRLALEEISPATLVHALREETLTPTMWRRAG